MSYELKELNCSLKNVCVRLQFTLNGESQKTEEGKENTATFGAAFCR